MSIGRRVLFLIPASLAFLMGCEPSPFPGYSEVEPGVYYRRHVLGDGERAPKAGDRLWVDVVYKTLEDSVLYRHYADPEGQRGMFRLTGQPANAFKKSLTLLREGDSASFIIEKKKMKGHQNKMAFQSPGQYLKLGMRVKKLLSREAYSRSEAREKALQQEEEKAIATYFEHLGKDPARFWKDGIYFMPLKEGQGKQVASGELLYVHYKGFFLDSTLFDDTYARNAPLDFRYGDPDQVLEGFGQGLSYMEEGGEALLLLPSEKAFGKQGSSTGIVPPWTPVLYRVELISVGEEMPE